MFPNKYDAKTTLNAFVASWENDFFQSGTNQLISRRQRCVDRSGSYSDYKSLF